MKREAATPNKAKTLAPFQKGQVWKIGDVNLAVTSVGKTLVHYKRYKTQRNGIQSTLTSKRALEDLLLSNNAVLVSE
jgi:hypothetical protein